MYDLLAKYIFVNTDPNQGLSSFILWLLVPPITTYASNCESDHKSTVYMPELKPLPQRIAMKVWKP